METRNYTSPRITVLKIMIEKGFAASKSVERKIVDNSSNQKRTDKKE